MAEELSAQGPAVESAPPEAPAAEPATSSAPEVSSTSSAPSETSTKPATRRARLEGIYDRLSQGESKDAKTPIEKQRDAAQKDAPKPVDAPKPPEQTAKSEVKKVAPKPTLKAPQSWNPEQRKVWEGLPDEAKSIIAKREREIGGLAQRYEQQWQPVRQFGEAFAKTVAPYRAMMEAEAAHNGRAYNPLFVVSQLLQTAASLRHADKRVGANVLAQTMQAYGISPEQVADALEGKGIANNGPAMQPQPQQPAFDPNKLLEQAEARVMKRLETARAQRDAQEADSEINEFATGHEHYETVRERMADLIEMNARRMMQQAPHERVALSLDEAYRIACLSDPSLAEAFRSAEAESVKAAIPTSPPAAPQKPGVAVASSIRTRPGGAARPLPGKPATRREQLAQIWAQRYEER